MEEQRVQLSEQIDKAQAQIEAALDELHRAATAGQDGGLVQARAQLQGLARLQQRLGSANAGDLAALRAEVAASVAATQALIQAAPASVVAGQAKEASLHAAHEAAHHAVENFVTDYFEKRKYDPYLTFASAEEEAEYRKREADRLREIRAAQAEGTPEGALKAADLAIAQMKDAGAHGASNSPDFAPELSDLEARRAALAGEIAKSVHSTIDRHRPEAAPQGGQVDPVAALLAAGVVVADQTLEGHGVSQSAASKPLALG